MDMSSVTQLLGGVNNQPYQQNQAIPGAPAEPVAIPGEIAPPATPVTLPGEIETYTPSGQTTFTPDRAEVSRLWNRHQERVDSFRQMIETLLNQQADRQNTAWNPFIEVTPEMRAEAQAMIDEGGYFSVEETAARILDFAVALSGGDPARIDVLQRAVERGFAQAERMFGGELPEISHQTMAAVQEGFDQWREGGVAAIALLNR